MYLQKKHPEIYLMVLILITLTLSKEVSAQTRIENYELFYATGQYLNQEIVVIRRFRQEGKMQYIAVNPNTLETMKITDSIYRMTPIAYNQLFTTLKNTAYIKALTVSRKNANSIQNSGIIHGYPKQNGIVLTIDLCPSHKPLDRVIFTSLMEEFKKVEQPVPLAISITGKFMETHAEDIGWLEELENKGEISIEWINHTFTHRYNPNLPLKNNFLLEANTNITFEILETEKLLLEHHHLFSVFFRFPGLVSNAWAVNSVASFGLIPIGSDAWLAKGQTVHSGSIVLIHGNGNEPLGVKDFIHLLQQRKSSVRKKQWLMYDLRESIEDEFKQ